jgi:FMN phosphatase YigB (HAD superfamily)
MLTETPPTELVVLLDVDNTLLENDRFGADLRVRLEQDFGAAECDRYVAILEALRAEDGYVDYLAALQRFRLDLQDHPKMPAMSAFMLDYPFAERLYPQTLAALRHLDTFATTVILSDGDAVFQPRKVQRSGLWDALQGRVLIYVHKETMLDAVQQRYPAAHYVMVDDKLALLGAIKRVLGERVTTVFVRQGHYARDASLGPGDPPADRTIEHIGELRGFAPADLMQIDRSDTVETP